MTKQRYVSAIAAVLVGIFSLCMAPAAAMMIKREIKDPEFDFSLSEADKCSYSPDPHRVAGSLYFLIECEDDISKVDLTFSTNPTTLGVYDVNMNRLSLLSVYPTSGQIQTYYVKTCSTAALPETCTTYQFDVSLSDGKAPLLAHGGLTFSYFASEPPKFDPSVLVYDVELFAKEPITVAARAAPGYLVDFETGHPERGHLSRSAFKSYTPQGREGEVESFKIYVVNPNRSILTEYTINVHCVKSTNPRLGQVEVSPGRLDPIFRSHKYAYFLRIPETSRKLSLSMTAVNDRDTQCFVQPEGLALEQGVTANHNKWMDKVKSWGKLSTTTTTEAPKPIHEAIPIGSSGAVTFRFPKDHRSGNIVVDCVAADATNKVRYIFTVVPQLGGSTLLRNLEVVHHEFDRDFDPRIAGPYNVVINANEVDDEKHKWFSFRVVPTNGRAICKVEGREVDPQTNLSNYFRVLLGEKRRFRVSVRTSENAVEEEYFIVISRPAPWYKDARIASRIADWVGIASSTVAAMKGVNFINNAKFLHFISMSNRLNGNPETYDSYSGTLNKWNLQWNDPRNVYMVDRYHNRTFIAPPEDYSEILAAMEMPSLNAGGMSWFGSQDSTSEGERAFSVGADGEESRVEDVAAGWFGFNAPTGSTPSEKDSLPSNKQPDVSAGWFGFNAPTESTPSDKDSPPSNKQPDVSAGWFGFNAPTGSTPSDKDSAPSNKQPDVSAGWFGFNAPTGSTRSDKDSPPSNKQPDVSAGWFGFNAPTGSAPSSDKESPPSNKQPDVSAGWFGFNAPATSSPSESPSKKRLQAWGADLVEHSKSPKRLFGFQNVDEWDAFLKQAASKLQMWQAPIQSPGSDLAVDTAWQPIYSNQAAFEASLSRVLSDLVHEKINAAQAAGSMASLYNQQPLRMLLPEDPTDMHDIIMRVEADYKAQQSLLNFCSSIVITSLALLVVEIIYASIWFLYLRDVRGGWTTIRQDFPAVLKPSRFWTFLLDYALITYLQSCCGILFSQGDRDAAIRLFGMTVTPNKLAWFAGSILICIPVTFLIWCLVVLFRIRQDLLYTKTFQRYGDSQSEELKAMQRFFKWIPLLSHFFTVEITSVTPVTRNPTTQRNVSDGPLRFTEETRTDAPLFVGDPDNIPFSPRRVDVERGMKKDGYEALLGETDPHRIRHRENGDMIKVTLPLDAFEARQDTVNPALYNRFPEAVVGFSKYKIQNPYDYIMNVRVEVQLRHLTSLMNLQSYSLWVPREHLQQDHVDNWNLLFGKSHKGNFFYWILDRCMTAAIILFLTAWSDRQGVTHTLVFGCVSLFLAMIYIPSAVATATVKWFRVMENEVEKRERQKRFEQLEQNRFKVWPFRRTGVREAFLQIRERKRDHEMWGMFSTWRSLVMDPIHGICELEFWRTRFFITLKECLQGPVSAEFMKFSTLFTLFLGNYDIGVYGNGFASLWGMTLTILALVCLNSDTFKQWSEELKVMCRELWILTRRSFINICDFFAEPQLIGRRVTFFFSSWQRVFQGERGVAFLYHGFTGERVRDYRVEEVCIINNEIGVHLPGSLEHSSKLKNEMRFSDCMQRRRFGIHKTLHINGSLGVHRCTLDRSMPIQLPFKQFFHLGHGPDESNAIQRVAATIQIVNYNESRGPSNHWHSVDDDSFMSLFTDPKLMPQYGKVRAKHQGHGYVVRWLRDKEMIFIRGPGIVEGDEYSVTSVAEKPPLEDEDVVSTTSSDTTLEQFGGRPGHDSADAICRSSGKIVVSMPEGTCPDVRCPVRVSRGNDFFDVDPDAVKIEYFEYKVGRNNRREMIVRSQRLTRSPTPYTVTWTIRTRGKKINATAKAVAHGVLYVPWTGDQPPDLTGLITLRNETEQSKLNGAVIDIDPRETDAHQFILPPVKYNGMSRIVAGCVSATTNLVNTIVGRDPSKDTLDDPIPCTIVQCVNPLDRQYRVEPNFGDAMKKVNAKIEELRGLKKDLETPEGLGNLWSDFMSTNEFIHFWNAQGVKIVVGGAWLNPLTNTTHMYVAEHPNRVRDGQMKFKIEIAKRIDSRIGTLSNFLDRYKIWDRAYNDADLYSGQLRRDEAEWKADRTELLESHVGGLQTIKKDYEAALMDFQYPMVVEDRLICRSEKFDAQLRIWREQLEAWLFQREGASLLDEQGGKSCVLATVDDVMRALKRSLRKTEHAHSGIYRTVLHYVISSVGVRGPKINWRPDPLAAHYCMVRLFAARSGHPNRVDWRQERWVPCFLKLSGNSIVMMFPHENDAIAPPPMISRSNSLKRWSWNQIQGYYIPLQCFEGMFLSIDPSIAQDTTVNDEARRMHAKLVLRKNTKIHIDERYVKSVQTGDFADEVQYDEGRQIWKIRLGHTVSNWEPHEYKTDDSHLHGNFLTVLPLTFRFHHSYFNKWQSAIRLAQMNHPHEEIGEFDGHVDPPQSDTSTPEPDPQPPRPILSFSTPTSSSDYSSTSSETESLFSKKTDTISDPTSSLAPPAPKPEEPVPVGVYKGQFRDGRFSGKNGRLYDSNGDEVYNGEWIEGQRWGTGHCKFRDANGVQWRFEGEFIADEMRKGKLTLIDDHETQRLRNSRDNNDRYRIVAYEGLFKLPRSLRATVRGGKNRDIRRMRSNCAVRMPPNISPHFMKQLFDTAEPVDGPQLTHRELIIDIRRAISACADEETAQATTALIQDNYGKLKATKFTRQQSTASQASDITIDAFNALEEYLPHRSRWTRLVDPNAGYQSVLDRFVDGEVIFADGSRYRGAMRNGLPDGRGVLFCPQCPLVCNGNWKQGRPHGYATLTFGDQGSPERLEYYGNFREGKREGRGVQLARNSKIVMKGDFRDDQLHGTNCSIELADDAVDLFPLTFKRYIGAVEAGIPQGKGKLTWPDGTTYKGEFKNGQRHGQGTMKDKNNRPIISGGWANDFPEGRITSMTLPDGKTVYTGDMKQGQRQGMGELYRLGDAVYEGFWMNDLPNGRGTLHSNDGTYDGEFRGGKRHGKGEFIFKNHPSTNGKRTYHGEWRDDRPDGTGKYLNEHGVRKIHRFKDGELQAASGRQGRSNKSPTINFAVESAPIVAHDTQHWGMKRRIDPDSVSQLNGQGTGVWQHHEGHDFRFMDPNESPRLSETLDELPQGPTKQGSMHSLASSEHEILEIRVLEGRGLPNPDPSNPLAPYCKVSLGPHTKKTKPINKAGANPKWNSRLVFPKIGGPVDFQVWDKDTLTSDEFVGGAEYDVSQFVRGGNNTMQVEIPLRRDNMETGSVVVQFTLSGSRYGTSETMSQSTLQTKRSNLNIQGIQQLCQIQVHSVSDLFCTEPIGKMDPYLKFELGSNKVQTDVKRGGGKNCTLDFALTMPYNNEPSLRFEVWDHDRFSRDDLVGYGSINFSSFTTGEVEIFRDDKKQGHISAGRVNLSVTIVRR